MRLISYSSKLSRVSNLSFYYLFFISMYTILSNLLFFNASAPFYYLASPLFLCGFLILFVSVLKLNPTNILGRIYLLLPILLFLLFSFVSVAVQQIFFNDVIDYSGDSALTTSLKTFALGCFWLVVGMSFKNLNIRSFGIWPLIFILIIISLFLLKYGIAGVSYYELKMATSYDAVNHLTFSVPVIIFSLSLFSCTDKKYLLPMFFFICIFLFLQGGRGVFFIFILSSMISYYFFSGKAWKLGIIFTLSFILFLFSFFSLINDSNYLDYLTSDGSFVERMEIFSNAISRFHEQFWFGGLGVILEQNGSLGGYSHNFLSTLEYFGFFSMFFILLSFFSIFNLLVNNNVKRHKTPTSIFIFYISTFILLSFMLTRHIGFALIWFILGYWLMQCFNLTEKDNNLI